MGRDRGRYELSSERNTEGSSPRATEPAGDCAMAGRRSEVCSTGSRQGSLLILEASLEYALAQVWPRTSVPLSAALIWPLWDRTASPRQRAIRREG